MGVVLIYILNTLHMKQKSCFQWSESWRDLKLPLKKYFFLLSDKKIIRRHLPKLICRKSQWLWEPDLQSLPYIIPYRVGKLISGLTSYGCHFKLQYFAFIWTQTHFKTIVGVQSPSWYQAEHLIMHIDILDIV